MNYYILQDAYFLVPNTPSQYEHVRYPCLRSPVVHDDPITDQSNDWDSHYNSVISVYPYPTLSADGMYRYPENSD
jgi:hypothetical protein